MYKYRTTLSSNSVYPWTLTSSWPLVLTKQLFLPSECTLLITSVMILHLRPHVHLFIFHFQVMKIKAIEREYLPVSPTKLSTVLDFTSCSFQRVKNRWSYLGMCSSFVHRLLLFLSYLCAPLVIFLFFLPSR